MLLLTCGLAIGLGRSTERIGAAIAIAASGATALVFPVTHAIGIYGRYGFWLVDAATLVAFDALMIRSRFAWPIVVTGLQLATLALDTAVIVEPVGARPFFLVQGKLGYVILCIIAAAAVRRRIAEARSSFSGRDS